MYPEWVGCLGKIHKPVAPGAGEGRKADRPGLIFPGATDRGYLLFVVYKRVPEKRMCMKGFDQYRYRKSPAIRSFNMVFRFSTAILRMA